MEVFHNDVCVRARAGVAGRCGRAGEYLAKKPKRKCKMRENKNKNEKGVEKWAHLFDLKVSSVRNVDQSVG